MTELPESICSRLAVQLVVTLVQFHYPRLRGLHREVVLHSKALAGQPEWERLLSSYRVLSREVLELMGQQDALVFDRVQILAVRKQLAYGTLSGERREFERLRARQEALSVVRRRLEESMQNTLPLHAESRAGAELRLAIKAFCAAYQEQLDFERQALVPVLGPFLRG
ncbi:MAG TPA: hypothetical protein VGD87_10830 [Archangium sp.]